MIRVFLFCTFCRQRIILSLFSFVIESQGLNQNGIVLGGDRE
jgi:hypothetical protein